MDAIHRSVVLYMVNIELTYPYRIRMLEGRACTYSFGHPENTDVCVYVCAGSRERT
jgi:hypothetical protein